MPRQTGVVVLHCTTFTSYSFPGLFSVLFPQRWYFKSLPHSNTHYSTLFFLTHKRRFQDFIEKIKDIKGGSISLLFRLPPPLDYKHLCLHSSTEKGLRLTLALLFNLFEWLPCCFRINFLKRPTVLLEIWAFAVSFLCLFTSIYSLYANANVIPWFATLALIS